MLTIVVNQCVDKEFVIDIDLTDYDSTRTCCDKANICSKCWRFASAAVKVLGAALKSVRYTVKSSHDRLLC